MFFSLFINFNFYKFSLKIFPKDAANKKIRLSLTAQQLLKEKNFDRPPAVEEQRLSNCFVNSVGKRLTKKCFLTIFFIFRKYRFISHKKPIECCIFRNSYKFKMFKRIQRITNQYSNDFFSFRKVT